MYVCDNNISFKMKCISRITDDTYAQFFGNGRNKFYVEFKCGRTCISTMDVCAKCFEKNSTCKLQDSRKFNHAKVNEPIPDESHIYGGKWYNEGVKKWGVPCVEILEYAIQCQKEARGDYVVEQPDSSPKDKVPDSTQEMARVKKIVADATDDAVAEKVENAVKRRIRKPKIVSESAISTSVCDTIATTNTSEIVTCVADETVASLTSDASKKKTRKPKVAQSDTEPKKSAGRKKKDASIYSPIISTASPLVHKEVVLPTHMESKLEEFDTDGYRIEYVRLVPFECSGTTYFRDSSKNKLYKKVKDKIGDYVGRWNQDTDMIMSDVPDSDDERI